MNQKSLLTALTAILLAIAISCPSGPESLSKEYVSYEVDPSNQELRFYWKDDNGHPFKSIGNLKSWLDKKGKRLVFAANAGMYKLNNIPLGLFVENGKLIVPLDTSSGTGNFYLKPNGVFYTTAEGKAIIVRTEDFRYDGQIRYATQSGPLLLIDGAIHAAFNKSSLNLIILFDIYLSLE